MRRFTEAFLDRYLEAEGIGLLSSVGAYRLEGLGAHLFDSVDGEQSAILGLPLLPLPGVSSRVRVVVGLKEGLLF